MLAEGCASCHEPGEDMHLCRQCNYTAYCSAECQSRDWNGHAKICALYAAKNHRADILRLIRGGKFASFAGALCQYWNRTTSGYVRAEITARIESGKSYYSCYMIFVRYAENAPTKKPVINASFVISGVKRYVSFYCAPSMCDAKIEEYSGQLDFTVFDKWRDCFLTMSCDGECDILIGQNFYTL